MSRASSVGLACRVSNIRCSGAHRAQELLETTDANIELIAARTGMGTAATLRRHLNRLLGVPPRRTVAPSAMIGLPPAPGRGEAAGFRHADRATFGRVGRLGGPTGERATRGRRVCRPTRAPPNVQR